MVECKDIEALKENKPTLLAVLAHPDDETFGMGGTLALYAQRWVAVHLVCATRGEVGEMDEQYLRGYHSVGEAREAELRCAAEKLGLTGVHFLGYRDSGMPGSPDNQHPQALAARPIDEVAAKILHYLRLFRPQVVLTFDPIGGYHHPDHVAVHQATVRAFSTVNDENGIPSFPDDLPPYQPDKLYFHTISRRFLRLAVHVLPLAGVDLHKWGRNKDIDLVSLAVDDFPVQAVIDYRPVRELKEEASACHASQRRGRLSAGPVGWMLRLGGSKEAFMRAYPPNPPRLKERDLFEGIHF